MPDHFLPRSAQRYIGKILCTKYRILHVLGVGGASTVFAAKHRNGRAVAVKILRERVDLEVRSQREARLANRVNHPGVVSAIDDDVTEDGHIFLVMPLLEGETVHQRALRSDRKLPLAEVVVVANELLDVLEAAHASHVVHRDIKPDNLFITQEIGDIRVIDWGIARLLAEAESTITHTGRAMGTPAFMAPEHALGQDVDRRTDLWAVGATMFSLLSGQHVHEAPSGNEVFIRAATRKARPLAEVAPEIPAPFCQLIDRALEFDRSDRWPDAATMRAALIEACRTEFGVEPRELPRLHVPAMESPTSIHDAQKTDSESWEVTTPTVEIAPSTELTVSEPPPPSSKTKRTAGGWRGRLMTSLAVGAIGVLAGGAIVGLTVARGGTAPQENVSGGRHGDPTPHIAASRSAWLGAGRQLAREEAQKAITANGASPEARLAILRTGGLWPNDGDREHFAKAYQARGELSPSARNYLEALAPAMAFPPNFRASSERFEALYQKAPTNLEVAIALAQNWIRIGRVADAVAVLEPLAQPSDAPGVVLQLLAVAYGHIDNIDASRKTLHRCLANVPGSSSCAIYLGKLELNEGHCADAERILRQDLEANPNDADAYSQLASALEARGASIQEISTALHKAAQLRDGAPGGLSALAADYTLAMHGARFNDALAISAKHENLLQSNNDAGEHYDAAVESIYVRTEIGMLAEAREAVERYTANRNEFFGNRQTYSGDRATALNGLAAQLGLISWPEWTVTRDARLSRRVSRDGLVHGPQRAWLEFYATPATTPATAQEALAVLPKYAPILSRTDRWIHDDAAVGTVYWLAGSPVKGLSYFERAWAACTRLDDPFQHTRMLMQYGTMLEDMGQTERACEAYQRVLHYWPPGSGSTTAAQAATRAAAVCFHR